MHTRARFSRAALVVHFGTCDEDFCAAFQGTLIQFRARPRPSRSWMTGRAGAGDLSPEAGPARTTPPLLQTVTWR